MSENGRGRQEYSLLPLVVAVSHHYTVTRASRQVHSLLARSGRNLQRTARWSFSDASLVD